MSKKSNKEVEDQVQEEQVQEQEQEQEEQVQEQAQEQPMEQDKEEQEEAKTEEEPQKMEEDSEKKQEEEEKEKKEEETEEEVQEPPTKKAKEDDEQEDAEAKAKEKKEQEEEKKRPPELEKFWKAVTDDPADFTGWTYLLQYVDTNGEPWQAREAYDAFLHRYPYCYGYWKKYADYEKRKSTNKKERAMMVFERGIKAIPLSVDLWIHYLNHVKGDYVDQPEFVRAQYERALNACGKEWRSDKLWDNYVKWETSETKNLPAVLKLYDRIIRNPTQGLSHQFEMFRDFVKEHNPKDLLDINDFLALRKEVLEALSKSKKDDDDAKDKEEKKEEEGGAPGEDDSRVTTDEENQALREKIIFSRKKTFKETEEAVSYRWKFEDQIKRPYFHMKPL